MNSENDGKLKKQKHQLSKIYKKTNVYEEALNRIRYLFDEFPNIVVEVSGGKDSTIVFNLALIIAREKNRLPLKVMFIDQEAEWEATVNMIKTIMYNPDVQPYWFQIPIKLLNATSEREQWLHCWEPEREKDWIHPQDPISIKENIYGTDRFVNLFTAISNVEFKDQKTAYLAGVRTDESPTRLLSLTGSVTYNWITWGRVTNSRLQHYTFYPIYDWGVSDVWKAINDNKWPYNSIYDAQFRYGVPIQKMRVSNIHHETAVSSLFYLQEMEPQTYQKLTNRIGGIDMAGKMGVDNYFVKDLPFMFSTWKEYRDYLLSVLFTDEKTKATFKKEFDTMDNIYGLEMGDDVAKIHIQSMLANDIELTKVRSFKARPKNYQVKVRYREKVRAEKEAQAA